MSSILIIDDTDKYWELCTRFMPEHEFLPPARNYREAAETLVDALRADVLATTTREDGGLAAWEVFEAHMTHVPRPWPPELEAVESAVSRLRACGPALVRGDLPAIAECRDTIREAQATIRRELAALHRRLVQAQAEEG